MASQAVYTVMAINSDELSTPSADQRYPLGVEVTIQNSGSANIKKFVYLKAHTGLNKYQPYIATSTSAGIPVTAAPVTGAARIVVPQVDVTTAYYAWFQVQGTATLKIGTETYAAGDNLEVLTTGTVANVDGTSGATVRTLNSFAMSLATGSTTANISAYLYGSTINSIAAT